MHGMLMKYLYQMKQENVDIYSTCISNPACTHWFTWTEITNILDETQKLEFFTSAGELIVNIGNKK